MLIAPVRRENAKEFETVFAITEAVMGFVPNSMLIMARDPALLAAFSETEIEIASEIGQLTICRLTRKVRTRILPHRRPGSMLRRHYELLRRERWNQEETPNVRPLGRSPWLEQFDRPFPRLTAFVGREQSVPSLRSRTCNSIEPSFMDNTMAVLGQNLTGVAFRLI